MSPETRRMAWFQLSLIYIFGLIITLVTGMQVRHQDYRNIPVGKANAAQRAHLIRRFSNTTSASQSPSSSTMSSFFTLTSSATLSSSSSSSPQTSTTPSSTPATSPTTSEELPPLTTFPPLTSVSTSTVSVTTATHTNIDGTEVPILFGCFFCPPGDSGLLLFGIPDVPGVYPPPPNPPFLGFPSVTIGNDGSPTVDTDDSKTTDDTSSTTPTSTESSPLTCSIV